VSTGPARVGQVAFAIYLVASATTAIVAGKALVKRVAAARSREPAPPTVALVAPPSPPIPAEAQLFHRTVNTMSIGPTTPRERSAHPRTLRTFRFLRGYPGAPPRVPHGVTAEEFRTGACKECHERGGYSLRFAAYVPVTPHPELGMCLACHVGDDAVMGFLVPGADPNTRCSQCHGPSGGRPRPESAATWSTTIWPELSKPAPNRPPPPIPHDLALREDCVACHAGPGAVAEIRSPHASRAACRDCHVALDPQATSVGRPAGAARARSGGGR
jgi:cytochrome c-type protein NapB